MLPVIPAIPAQAHSDNSQPGDHRWLQTLHTPVAAAGEFGNFYLLAVDIQNWRPQVKAHPTDIPVTLGTGSIHRDPGKQDRLEAESGKCHLQSCQTERIQRIFLWQPNGDSSCVGRLMEKRLDKIEAPSRSFSAAFLQLYN